MRPYLFRGEDALRLTSWNSAASVRLELSGRFELPDGRVQAFAQPHTPNTDRTLAQSTYAMGEGRLLEAQVYATAGTPRRGQCFVSVEVVRGLTGAIAPLSALLQGYVTDTQRRGWPPGVLELSTVGPGVLRSIAGTNPAAGAELQETVPTNARWRLLSLLVTLVTDVNAANREVALTIDDGATVFLRAPSGVTQIASQTTAYCFSPLADRIAIAQDRTVTVPIPDLWLPGGARINSASINLLAGDNYGAPQLFVEELIED